ncbi:hypothetical protein TWF506_011103 [Arthrobotrys conoides]|uniref:F-box domain-containing protein n=1 Tax=Arthrobotrys conoides TaxID=74498 RepID=A0AAN8NQ13_9PEZI
MIVIHGFGSTNLLTTLRPGLTSTSTKMGLLPDPARFQRKPSIKPNLLALLPTEIILQIIEDDVLTSRDRVCFAATCRRFKDIVYPSLYRRFDWIAPFIPTCSVRLASGFGLLVEVLLEPVISGLSMMLGLAPPPDPHLISFQKRAELVREMSILGGYQYYKEMDIVTRYYGPLNDGDPFISLFEPFQNLRSIEFDERAAVSWTGYLRVIASILVSKPTLEDLTLRHRLAAQPDARYEMPANMESVHDILSKGVVSKLRGLTIILGRRFEPTEMGYKYFHQLMEVFEGTTNEVTVFKLFTNYSKLDETDPLLIEGISNSKECTLSPVKLWSFPKIREVEIHAHNFPDTGAVRSIEKSSLSKAKKLGFACDIMNMDFEVLSQNLSSFLSLEELSIWDPQWPEAREYTNEELIPICEKFSLLKNNLERLDSVDWTLGYQKSTTHCTLKYPVDSRIPIPTMSFVRSKGMRKVEKNTASLPEPVRYIKEGYISAR